VTADIVKYAFHRNGDMKLYSEILKENGTSLTIENETHRKD
jgi:hypothetical protein